MAISRWDIMRLSEQYDGEFNFADFSEEELKELLELEEPLSKEELRERYFAEHDDVKDRTLSLHRWAD
ncbi:MAG: hypothetical protein J6D37_07670 [Clostridia bacterium]|nr:hypothetical protein [Clostridia bacterium]